MPFRSVDAIRMSVRNFRIMSQTRLAQIYNSTAASTFFLSFWARPRAHSIFVGFNFTSVSAALRATVPRIALKVIISARCVEPYDGIGRAMPLRRLFARKGLHPLAERCADT
jgi:hypothetical protein